MQSTPTTPALLARVWDVFIPAQFQHDADLNRQARRYVGFNLATLFWIVFFCFVYTMLGSSLSTSVMVYALALNLAGLAALHAGRSPAVCANLLCFCGWSTCTALAALNGGAGAPSTTWYAILPLLAMLLGGRRAGIFWTTAGVVSLVAFQAARDFGLEFPIELTPTGARVVAYSGLPSLVICVYILMVMLNRAEAHSRQAVDDLKARLGEVQTRLDSMQGRFDFSMAEWIKLDEEKRVLERQLKDAKRARRRALSV